MKAVTTWTNKKLFIFAFSQSFLFYHIFYEYFIINIYIFKLYLYNIKVLLGNIKNN